MLTVLKYSYILTLPGNDNFNPQSFFQEEVKRYQQDILPIAVKHVLTDKNKYELNNCNANVQLARL